MSMYVKGMKMPESCSRCPMYKNCAGHDLNPLADVGRGEHCPLVSVPPHGRLIDLDALFRDAEQRMKNEGLSKSEIELNMAILHWCFENPEVHLYAPIVIEADEE